MSFRLACANETHDLQAVIKTFNHEADYDISSRLFRQVIERREHAEFLENSIDVSGARHPRMQETLTACPRGAW